MRSEVPTMDDFMRPILEYANQRRSFALREITDAMADHFNLSPEARAKLTRGGNIDKVYDRTSWAITHLKHAGFLRQLGRGRYEITDAGRKQLLLKDKISVSYLTQNVPAYQQWKQSRTSKKNHTTNEKASAINETYSFYGASGRQYDYYLSQNLKTIPALPGNYMLAAWHDNKWQVLYVGESENLRNRLVNNRHEKTTDATVLARLDLVRILYDANEWNEDRRRKAKKDLIGSQSPPLNFQDTTQNDKDTQQDVKKERIPKPENYGDKDESTHNSNSEAKHKAIKTRLGTIQKATPLAEYFEWDSSNQKIRHIPVPVSDATLWKNDLERLRDEILDIKNNSRLSNTHAALTPEVERLELKLERYKSSPQQCHDEMETMLMIVQSLENEGEISNDIHTQRFKKVLTDCILDIRGDVPKVQEAIEKRKRMRLTQISKDEQKSLSSITEDVIPYIEEERIKQDMQEDIEVLRENQNATDSQEKTFKKYRLISRLSRMFILLLKNDPDIWRTVKQALINKFIEIIFKMASFF